MNRIAIRREDKNHWERRVPLIPDAVVELVAADVPLAVQPSEVRAFPDEAYATAGATIREDIEKADLILGVKEVPPRYFQRPAAWMFFSHTIKGQADNMPMLQALLDSGSTLFDYELITDEDGRRLVFFGRHAGYAGMVETLVALSARWTARGLRHPFKSLRQPYMYSELATLVEALGEIGEEIDETGFEAAGGPPRIAVLGNGNVSSGVQAILNALPTQWHTPSEYLALGDDADPHRVHAAIFQEEDLVRRRDGSTFDLKHFYDHPAEYEPTPLPLLTKSTAVVTTYYWDDRFPRYISNAALKEAAHTDGFRLEVIGDITCDIDGSVEPTVRPTDPGDPCYGFDPRTGEHTDEITDDVLSIMAVDNLPCELSVDASRHFSLALLPFIVSLSDADLEAPTLEESGLSATLRRACIAWRGDLTQAFVYLKEPLNAAGGEP